MSNVHFLLAAALIKQGVGRDWCESLLDHRVAYRSLDVTLKCLLGSENVVRRLVHLVDYVLLISVGMKAHLHVYFIHRSYLLCVINTRIPLGITNFLTRYCLHNHASLSLDLLGI